jgi:hypothetical protein
MRNVSLGFVLCFVLGGCTTNNNTYIVGDDGGGTGGPGADAGGPICTPGAKDCVDDTLARVCAPDGLSWVGKQCASGETCMAGDCKFDVTNASCTPGDGACVSASMAVVCNDSGIGYKQVTCPTGTNCGGAGLCFGTCVVGESRCDNAGTISTCTDGNTFTPAACPSGQLCVGLQSMPYGIAKCVSSNDCQPDPTGNGCDTVCGNKLNPSADQTKFTSTCVATSDGFKWQVSGCLAPQTCSPTAGQCGSLLTVATQAGCASECNPGDKICGADQAGVLTCDATTGKFGAEVPCDLATGQVCFLSGNTAICGDPICSTGAKGICVVDTDGVSKLRECTNGRLATTLTACATGLCQPDLTVPAPPTGTAGACIADCQSGDMRCNGTGPAGPNAIQTCGANGVWNAATTACGPAANMAVCFNYTGTNGRPAAMCGACQPGTDRCVNGGGTEVPTGPNIELCGATGQWGASVACTVGVCNEFAAPPLAACMADCIPNQKLCIGMPKMQQMMSGLVIDGTDMMATCPMNGMMPTSGTTCTGLTSCRKDQAGNALGCVTCVGGTNENGITDTRCSNMAGTGPGNAAVQVCNSSNMWATPTQCAAPNMCQDPSPQLARVSPYCHECFGLGQACTDSLLQGFGYSCASFVGFGGPVTCAGFNAGDPSVTDCCTASCVADVAAPATCGQ